MNTTTRNHLATIENFIKAQMDGEQPPPAGTAAETALCAAIEDIQSNHSTPDVLSTLGLLALGSVIDRMRSSIKAQETLIRFIAPGDRS